MIFEKLGMSLYDVLKKNQYKGTFFNTTLFLICVGFSIDLLQSFARQILISVGFMHSIKLTHTDLKVIKESIL